MTKLENQLPTAKKVGRPSVAAAARIEASILDAATLVFMKHGSRATMNEIVEASGLSRKTVYSRYESKQAVFRAMVQRLFKPGVDIGLQFSFSNDISKTLNAFIDACIKESTTPHSIALRSLLNADPEAVSEVVPTIMDGLERRYVEPLESWLTLQCRRGIFRPIDTSRVANMIVSITLAEANRIAGRIDNHGANDLKAEFTSFLADLILKGIVK